ncbi:hypothetical protein Godav_008071 [Gossypium davidsonii]|uniref:RRM domain-containing protein n=1 Tax=Gossypium davidsonii TaxID=34287 RepID=A0A7J8S8V1_GOSDV|nr:hypothetical protein [Gossypium davidsonii]
MSRVYVGNLDPRVSERDLEDEFRVFGVIRSVWVARRPPGYAFIDFDDRRDAEDAIRELDEVIVLVPDLQDVAVPLLVGTASLHHIVVVRSCHMLTEMVQGNTDKAGAKYCKDVKFIEETEIKCV